MIIRNLNVNDIDQINSIADSVYTQELYESPDVVLQKITLFANYTFGLFENEKLIAYIISLPTLSQNVIPLNELIDYKPQNFDTIYICDIAVSLSHHNKGVATLLVNEVFKLAYQLKISKLNLVAVQNSEKFWGKFGFKCDEHFLYANVNATKMSLIL